MPGVCYTLLGTRGNGRRWLGVIRASDPPLCSFEVLGLLRAILVFRYESAINGVCGKLRCAEKKNVQKPFILSVRYRVTGACGGSNPLVKNRERDPYFLFTGDPSPEEAYYSILYLLVHLNSRLTRAIMRYYHSIIHGTIDSLHTIVVPYTQYFHWYLR